MKKLLSMVATLALSAMLFVGCGPDTTAMQKASADYQSLTQGLAQEAQNGTMDTDAITEYQDVVTGLAELGKDMTENPGNYTDQAKIDDVTKQFNDANAKLKEIADQVGYDYSSLEKETTK